MSHDDFAFEPIRGLPETPPEGEEILWQGAPDWWALAWDAFALKWVAGYFVVLVVWRAAYVAATAPLHKAILSGMPFLILGGIVIALLALIAYVQARTTVYTITNRRVAMRVGAALTVTLNLPYRCIASADLARQRAGSGTIALSLIGNDAKLSYLVCWPHVRPWRMAQPQPALRCIPNVANVAQILAEAAETRVNEPLLARRQDVITVPLRSTARPNIVAAE